MSLLPPEKVRKLQQALHAKAKGAPAYRFYALYDKLYRGDVLLHAYHCCAANGGAAGVDGQTFADIEAYGIGRWLGERTEELKNQTYRPEAVRRVFIPKPDGQQRPLGIPTVKDRVVQMAALLVLEPIFEADLQPEQYAYRQGRSALDAIVCVQTLLDEGHREVVDADLSGYFASIPHAELMKSVARRISDRHLLALLKRWLEAPVQERDAGGHEHRTTRNKDEGRGTPQGAPLSPLLANLFLHHAFDSWMRRNHPSIPFERYADDVIVHAKSKAQAEQLLEAIRARLAECGLELHPEKTRIIYCQDSDRKGQHEHIQFDFLGYTFRPRRAKNYRGKPFVSFLPGVSNKAGKAIRTTIRDWRLAATRNNQSLEDLARLVNPSVSGWVSYYGRFYRSALPPVLRHLERALIRWACRKYKRFRGHVINAAHWLGRVARRDPNLFVLWQMGIRPAT